MAKYTFPIEEWDLLQQAILVSVNKIAHVDDWTVEKAIIVTRIRPHLLLQPSDVTF